ncbi:MAG: efflux RND transporter permease subunit [candidate division SR1 bacterium]|nr:efflux RND transporter permease subunit [candidate division SR1 bacterium]
MIKFLKTNKVAILVFTVFIGIYGAFSVFTIPKEAQPSVNIPYYYVSVSYLGADPSSLEEQVIIPLEQKIKSITNIDKITSSCYYNFGTILVQFTTAKSDVDATNDLKAAIDQVYPTLPSDVNYPSVKKISVSDTPVYSFSVAGNFPTQVMYTKLKSLEDQIKSVAGVSDINIIGKPVQEVKLTFDAQKLAILDLDFTMIVGQLKGAFVKFPVDKKDVAGKLYSFEITNYETNLTGLIEQLKNYDLLNIAGKTIKLRDVATVYIGYKQQDKKSFVITNVNTSDTQNALSFQIKKSPGYSLDTFVDALKTTITDYAKTTPDLTYTETLSQKESIQRTYGLFMENFRETALLVFCIILLFLGWRSSWLIMLSFLIVYLANFIYLKSIGSFNNIVSFALILVLGIMIDNLIVITQGIVVGLQKYAGNIWDAIGDSLKNYGKAIFFGTLTTIVIFIPLYFGLTGVMGEYLKAMPITIISNLAISLVVTMFILPVLALFFYKSGQIYVSPPSLSFLERSGVKFANRYHRRNQSRWGSRGIVFMFLVFFVGALSLMPLGVVKFSFMGNMDSNNVWMNLKYSPGISLEDNQAYTSKVAHATLKYFQTVMSGMVKDISIDLGQGYSLQGAGGAGNNMSSFTIRLVDTTLRNKKSFQIVEQMQKELLPALKQKYAFLQDASIFTVQAGGGSGKPITFSILGDDYKKINTYIQKILPDIKTIPGVYNVGISIEYTNGKIVYILDENKAKSLGITSMSSVTSLLALKNAAYESNGIQIKEFSDFGSDALSVNAFLSTDMSIEQTKIGKIPLDQIIKQKELQPEINAITRLDGKRNITVQADKTNSAALSDITSAINKVIEKYPLPEGLTYTSGGDIASQAQSMQDLGSAMLIGLLLMILVLIIQFNNIKYALVIVSSVFLSLGGTIVILALTGYDMTFPAMIGIFGVMGVGVNQALIHLEDFKYYYQEQGFSVIDSFQQSIAERFIPIFLTKVTTIIGLLILAFKDELFGSMAIAFIGGLIISFFITLLYIPSLMNLVSKEHYKHNEKGIMKNE